VRRGPADLGADDANRQLDVAHRELKEARVAAGLSQASAARAAGLSSSAYGRLEGGALRATPIESLAVAARAVGLSLSLRLCPAGSPARDAGQLRLEQDYVAVLGPGLAFRPEAPLPIAGDPRAWDGVVVAPDGLGFTECEMRLGDVQDLLRRNEAKLRDDPRSRILVLVVRSTRHNRRMLSLHREALRPLLPLDGAAILRSLRAGRLPRGERRAPALTPRPPRCGRSDA
jgi:transcriptional regulator with XRE-family HTH domain